MKQNEKQLKNKNNISTDLSIPQESKNESVNLLNTPIVSQLTGIVPQEITIDDYKEYLLKKHSCN